MLNDAREQLSLVLGLPKTTPLAAHWPTVVLVVTLAGQPMIGGSVSLTVTVKLQLVLLHTLEDVQLTVVVPTEKTCGEVMSVEPILHSTVGDGLPVPITVKATFVEHWPAAAARVMSSGQIGRAHV